jgi:dTDP-4-dehydrorhamnose 3,5-epimerase
VDLVATRIPDVVLLKPRVFRDERGYLLESWNRSTFLDAGIAAEFVQDNHSHSTQGVLRGLHYQVNPAQGKLVRVSRGTVFDVAVDLRRSSPTFGAWVGTELSERNNHMLWIPPGFAHGFLALTSSVDVMYKCTQLYAADRERRIVWNDSHLSIDWPLPPGMSPLVSAKDARAGDFAGAECFP